MTERFAQAAGAGRIARSGLHGRVCRSEYTQPIPNRRRPSPTVYNGSFLIFRTACIPSAARLPPRILRGFLEREANVKQTHRFR